MPRERDPRKILKEIREAREQRRNGPPPPRLFWETVWGLIPLEEAPKETVALLKSMMTRDENQGDV